MVLIDAHATALCQNCSRFASDASEELPANLDRLVSSSNETTKLSRSGFNRKNALMPAKRPLSISTAHVHKLVKMVLRTLSRTLIWMRT